MAGVIDYSCNLFRFKLPQTESWRSLPLLKLKQVQGPPTELIYQAPVAQTLTAPILNQLEAVSETGPAVAAVQPATRTLQPLADNDEEPPELWDGKSDRGDRDDDLPDLVCESDSEYEDEEPADEQPGGPGGEPPDPNAPPDGDAVTPAEAEPFAAVCSSTLPAPPRRTRAPQ
jgi:hypothetical protein